MLALRHLLVTCLLLSSCCIQAAEKVVLQLKWEPSFQFAGYYAALWQGYYADEGLNVEIRSAFNTHGEFLEPVNQLATGQADFAIGNLDALKAKDQGLDIKIASAIYQHSPIAIYSLASTPLNSVRDLSKLRISVNSEDMAAVARALMQVQGFEANNSLISKVQRHNNSHLAPLLDGSADAIMTYGVAATMEAEKANVALNELKPSDFGLELYGDTLLTTQTILESRPGILDKFRKASIKGWKYALNNRVDIAKKIATDLPRQHYKMADFEAFNLSFANIIDEYMVYPYVPVGQNNPARWREIVSDLRQSGALVNNWNVDTLFVPEGTDNQVYWHILIATIITLLLLLVPLLFTRYRVKRAWPYMLVILFTVAFNILIQAYVDRTEQQQAKLDGTQYLNSLTTKMLEIMRSHLAITDSLAIYISLNPDIDQSEFEKYAASIFRLDTLLNNIAAAPDMRIQMIYPMKGNQAALGIDYRDNLAQWQGVELAAKRDRATLDGPINLLQGGQAFLLHSPVYTGFNQLWGVVSAPLRTDVLIHSLGLNDPNLAWDIVISVSGDIADTERTLMGDKSLFADPAAVTRRLSIGGRTWHIAATPKQGQQLRSAIEAPLHIGSLLLSLLLCLFIAYSQRQLRKERNYQKAIQQNEQLLQEVGKLAKIDGWKMDAKFQFVQWNHQIWKTMGLQPALDRPPRLKELLALLDRQQASQIESCLRGALDGEPFDFEFNLQPTPGDLRWLRVIGHPIEEKRERAVVGAILDITEKKKSIDLIQHQASHDMLTGLPNRRHFNDMLDAAISSHKRAEQSLSVLFIDLDNFKPVNDNLGHKAGDELLRQVAQRIQQCVREQDVIARYSGDEFTAILKISDQQVTPQQVAQRVLDEVNKPYALEQGQVYCGASIGIAVYPDDGCTAEVLVSNADQAMYQVKKSGRNSWQSYSAELNAHSERKHLLHTRLAAALEAEQLQVHYQPIVSLSDQHIVKCEALVRWFDDGQLVPTDEFISLAEEVGLINKIDQFVLTTAANSLAQHNNTGHQPVELSVNVSPLIFSAQDNSLRLWMERVFEASEVLNVTVEITERLLTEDSERALSVLKRLREKGVRIAIDDFGTGYSSLSYLTKFPIDIIKIDRSFVSQLGTNATTTTLTNAILNLAQELSLEVVAEGIETKAQLSYLARRGCQFGQGYYLGKPMPEDAFLQQLRQQATIEDAVGAVS